jgi:hypothetical protein
LSLQVNIHLLSKNSSNFNHNFEFVNTRCYGKIPKTHIPF